MGAQTSINICSGVRLDNRYEHTMYFDDEVSQMVYFAGKVVKTFSAYSYIRRTWPLQVQATMEEARTWNYLYFTNQPTGKRYFYFITRIEYKNDSVVELTLELDVMQTYLPGVDYNLLDCFVERQHTPTDDFGEHTVDEGLEVGPLVNLWTYDVQGIEGLAIMILATINPNYTGPGEPVQALGFQYNGVFSGLKAWAVHPARWVDWYKKLEALSEAGYIDGIVAMWMYPMNLITLGGEATWEDSDTCVPVGSFPTTGKNLEINIPVSKEAYLADYHVPKNNKLLCYPYRMLYCDNNAGQTANYRLEHFGDYPTARFRLYGAISPDAPVLMVPASYNGLIENFDEAITLGNYPSCAWNSDIYKMWLAQNQNQHRLTNQMGAVAIGGGVLTSFASLLSGNFGGFVGGVGAGVSGYAKIAEQIAQKKDMAIQPPQSRGKFSTNINIVAGKQTFTFYLKSIRPEYARQLDDYFTMYGYKLNRVQKPNIKARPAFTYVKTVGCQIQGHMCTEDITKIESIFDNGITFWRDGDRVADYTQPNRPSDI